MAFWVVAPIPPTSFVAPLSPRALSLQTEINRACDCEKADERPVASRLPMLHEPGLMSIRTKRWWGFEPPILRLDFSRLPDQQQQFTPRGRSSRPPHPTDQRRRRASRRLAAVDGAKLSSTFAHSSILLVWIPARVLERRDGKSTAYREVATPLATENGDAELHAVDPHSSRD
jgi:hypothetical protein